VSDTRRLSDVDGPREGPCLADFYDDPVLFALRWNGEKSTLAQRYQRARELELEGRGPLVELRRRLASYGYVPLYRPHYPPGSYPL
jgi:hypothetical protein